ncbi:MAG: phosphoribosylaminoimidazolesuccinocarboxamide synthase [Candidatus Fermentibacteraceae bacterium]|nr:phosphoribosylaminoimidazolesuccinocarboxamide synthase [Candidatus Fermentibacteraceae bacterium]MBN2607960.1 phosphoribosylaminoimidazolesuccinocarboxamide synthase [Candidatus Fermentibacteraceae bacterium]
MFSRELIRDSLSRCLTDTSELGLPGGKRGKVRDSYDLGDRILLITTDRQSAFDRVLASVPFKGQVLNRVSAYWFENTRDIIPNHVISVPDPCATLAQKCSVYPVEFIVRGYLTGSTSTSAWTLYSGGSRNICGNVLPEGMVKNQRFPRPIVTPTTKSDEHDQSITPEEIVGTGLMTAAEWERASSAVLSLFRRGVEMAAANGLILVDTKYELGRDANGDMMLIDEIHTPDSSRYWLAGSYEERFSEGREPENIDKEFLRLWFRDNCDPYSDEELPGAPDDLVVELSSRYIRLFEMITGMEFEPVPEMDPLDRLRMNLQKSGILQRPEPCLRDGTPSVPE